MRFQGIFRDRRSTEVDTRFQWLATTEGLRFCFAESALDKPQAPGVVLTSFEIGALLEQLVTDDLASSCDGEYTMSWEQVYELIRSQT